MMAKRMRGNVDSNANSTALADAPDATTEAIAPSVTKDLVYNFRISRMAEPVQFRNLWELAFKSPKDKDFLVIIDADMLSTVIAHISYIFEQDGL